MTDPNKTLNAAQLNAQKYFAKPDQDEPLEKQLRKKERAENEAKTAKLRALRLAKEAAERDQAEKLNA